VIIDKVYVIFKISFFNLYWDQKRFWHRRSQSRERSNCQ